MIGSDEKIKGVRCVCCVEKVEEKSSTTASQRGLTTEKMQHQMTRRLERRKLQRNRTAFTPTQIDQLEQGVSHSLYASYSPTT